MNIKVDEGIIAKHTQYFIKIHRKVILLLNFLQTKPQIENMNFN